MDHFVQSVGTGGGSGGVDTTHEANSPSISTSTLPNNDLTPDGKGGFSLTSDAQPFWEDCSTRDAVGLSGTNIGDELNARGLSWGWFQGGFSPSTSCDAALAATGHSGQQTGPFIADRRGAGRHRPVGLQGRLHPASDFDQLVAAIATHELPPSALPAVSFLKAPGYHDGHAGYSDPRTSSSSSPARSTRSSARRTGGARP
jgi:phospholipase C